MKSIYRIHTRMESILIKQLREKRMYFDIHVHSIALGEVWKSKYNRGLSQIKIFSEISTKQWPEDFTILIASTPVVTIGARVSALQSTLHRSWSQ